VIGMNLATREADAAFADLICADPQWLDAEFDALIAASFSEPPGSPPPAPPRVPPRPGSTPPPSHRPAPGRATATELPASGTKHGRQRSPPAHQPADPQATAP
jgi:hypothetical protein